MRSEKATLKRRVEEVLQLRLLGATFADLREYAHDPAQGWNVSDGQLRRYIKMSDQMLEKSLEHDRARLINRHIAQRHLLYSRAVAVSDYRTALAVAQDEAKMLDLYPASRHEVTGRNGRAVEHEHRVDLSGLSTDELDALRRLAEKTARPAGDTPGAGPPPPA